MSVVGAGVVSSGGASGAGAGVVSAGGVVVDVSGAGAGVVSVGDVVVDVSGGVVGVIVIGVVVFVPGPCTTEYGGVDVALCSVVTCPSVWTRK